MNVMRWTALVFALLTPMLTEGATGQTAVVEGARIRISLPGQKPILGRLLAVGGDSLLLSPAHTKDFRAYPLSEIQSVKVSHPGIDGGAWKGMTVGSLAFAALFGLMYNQADGTLGWTVFGAYLGSVTGLIFGTSVSRETWAPAGVPAPRQERLPPAENRAALRTQLQLDALKPSSAIRLHTQDGAYVSGSYDGRDAFYARVTGDSSIVVPIENITGIAHQRAATGQFARRGLVIGTLAGAVGFGILGSRVPRDCGEGPCGPEFWTPVLGVFGAVSGGVTGLMIGSLIGSVKKRWQPYE